MKRLLLCVSSIVICLLVCTSCFGKEIVGKWYNGNTGYIIFESDGDFYFENDNISGTYEVSGSKVELTRDNGETFTWHYKITDDNLTITVDGTDKKVTFVKKD